MTKVLVLYYSSYGHIERWRMRQAEGARRVAGAEVVVKRVPELVPEEVARDRRVQARPAGADRDSERARSIRRHHSWHADALRQYGGADAQLSRPDRRRCGCRHALVGKVGSVFTSTASQHGGQETTITSFHTTLLHFGMVIVGLPYTYKDLSTMREVTGGTPYGASSITGAGAEFRLPSALELDMCKYQGEHVTRITRDLVAGRAVK